MQLGALPPMKRYELFVSVTKFTCRKAIRAKKGVKYKQSKQLVIMDKKDQGPRTEIKNREKC